jgi:type VI protein secretion system component VasK
VCLEGVDPEGLPPSLRAYHHVDWRKERQMAELVARVPRTSGILRAGAATGVSERVSSGSTSGAGPLSFFRRMRGNRALRRRLLFAPAFAVLMVLGALVVESYLENRAFENTARVAIERVERLAQAPSPPPEEVITALDKLSVILETTEVWQAEGHPWNFGFGMYVGDEILRKTRAAYHRALVRLVREPLFVFSEKRLNSLAGKGREDLDELRQDFRTYAALSKARNVPRAEAREALVGTWVRLFGRSPSLGHLGSHVIALLDARDIIVPPKPDKELVETASKSLFASPR